ncbi:MAG TPA: PxKF domain-containing protein, partial [Methylomicrobium sp.]|nr:PxKF domain-containing protein [Methylomicrobium sp.]
FNEPIANDLINATQAGQTVPAKWRLSDANGLPIDNSTSFAGLYSYPIDCEIAENSPHDVIEPTFRTP